MLINCASYQEGKEFADIDVGVWGMNFDHMPELTWKWGYPAALGVIVSGCLVFWRSKRVGWL